ncbi:MAG TPA: hypothetical protein VFF75_04245 [Methylophilaceae bacterium]|nr:hypothetical protein [Methylophilaceae bacterium]
MAVFIIGLAATALLIRSFSGESLKAERQEDTMRALMQAKEAMIGWAVSHDEAPGQLPWPDKREVTGSPKYDGYSDCSNSNFNLLNSLAEPNFLGQLPYIESTAPCEIYPGLGNLFQDSSNSNLWYAVSRNLIRNYSNSTNPIINPSIIDMPTYPWMIVRDARGSIISDKVAIVVVAPGPPLSSQDRSLAAPPPSEFLDQITINGITYSNFDYDTDDEDFVMSDSVANVFNDKLVYITIDELMNALVKRAAAETRARLVTYNAANGRFPDAASIQAPLGANSYIAISGRDSGTVPFDVTDTVACNYLSSTLASCNVSFSLVSGVAMQRIGGGQWSSRSGSCNRKTTVYSNDTCSCTGAGSCSSSILNSFSCTADGVCNMFLITGTGTYLYSPAPYAAFPAVAMSGNCSASGVNVICSGDGAFGIRGLNMPSWFGDNRWQDYFYYHKRSDTDIQVGSRTNIGALIVGTGRPITSMPYAASKSASPQIRPSIDRRDYLDSGENADGDLQYESTNTPQSNNYNDQLFIVAP